MVCPLKPFFFFDFDVDSGAMDATEIFIFFALAKTNVVDMDTVSTRENILLVLNLVPILDDVIKPDTSCHSIAE